MKKGNILVYNNIPFHFIRDVSSQDIEKKEREICIIASFLSYTNQTKEISGPINIDESPDFYFETQSKKIAVELCHFFCDHNKKKGSEKKKLYQYKKEIIEKAKMKFEESNKEKLLLRIAWNDSSQFEKNLLIDELYTFVRATLGMFDKDDYFSLDQLDMNTFLKFKSNFPSLFSLINSISINKLTCNVSQWDFIESGWHDDYSKEIIELIKKKEHLLYTYRKTKPNHDMWLLIHSNSRFIHETIHFKELNISTMTSNLQTGFSKILLFDILTHKSLNIPIR